MSQRPSLHFFVRDPDHVIRFRLAFVGLAQAAFLLPSRIFSGSQVSSHLTLVPFSMDPSAALIFFFSWPPPPSVLALAAPATCLCPRSCFRHHSWYPAGSLRPVCDPDCHLHNYQEGGYTIHENPEEGNPQVENPHSVRPWTISLHVQLHVEEFGNSLNEVFVLCKFNPDCTWCCSLSKFFQKPLKLRPPSPR